MKSAIIAVAAFAASAAASVGSAVIINKCDYAVAMQNVPADGGGATEVDKTLDATTGTYTQEWTELTNGAGWSMKLWPITGSNTADTNSGNIMQYEYTYDPTGDFDDTIWFDLSDVNGNPWNGNWEITGDGNCSPLQQAYRYATDDAYGEQSCDSNSTVTVTLCSGDDTSSPSSVSSVAASTTAASSTASAYSSSTTPVESSTEASSTTAAATSSAVKTSSTSDVATSTIKTWHHGYAQADVVATPSPTTLATLVSTTSDGLVIVTDVAYTTVVATTTVLDKRFEHLHQRDHLHQHAARHPHARQ